MTIRELHNLCNNIDPSAIYQLFKAKEIDKYYSEDYDNLLIMPMTYAKLPRTNIKVDRFTLKDFDEDGYSYRVLILLEGDDLL